MLYKNANLFLDGERFVYGDFLVENGRFAAIGALGGGEHAIDLCGATVIPGLIDIHTHGNSGADFSDGDYAGLKRMGKYLLTKGVTAFAPTSMTLPYEQLGQAFATAKRLYEEAPPDSARLIGIHMEGPFLSAKKKGSQNAAYLKKPDYEAFRDLYDSCGGLIRIVGLAPELEGAVAFTERVSTLCTVSVAHTAAGYEQAAAIYRAGATHLTHLYNAMPPILHRQPGVIGAAAERETVYAELICDGLHVHPSAVRMAFQLFPGRICLISDALRCCGMPEGQYLLGGETVFLKDGAARLADGTLAGSAIDLYACMQKTVSFGIPKETTIRAATLNPAKQLGCSQELGSISVGKRADFIVCDADLTRRSVFFGGAQIA